ncbi:MAG: hypothetical protein PHX51_08535, partial [Clostridia bacterium]|nr:hypothetical protein [Clostridia bacterium]
MYHHDLNGRLRGVSDQAGRNYGFKYNQFGEATEYYDNSVLIKEKNVERIIVFTEVPSLFATNVDVVTEKVYKNASPDTAKSIIDKYGKVTATLTNNNSKMTTFGYQSIPESRTVAKISRISDPHDGQIYNYQYNSDNQPCGYTTSGSSNTGAKQLSVRQIGADETQYTLNGGNRTSTVISEDAEGDNKKYFQPRIKHTLDKDSGFAETDKDFDVKYDYDQLG